MLQNVPFWTFNSRVAITFCLNWDRAKSGLSATFDSTPGRVHHTTSFSSPEPSTFLEPKYVLFPSCLSRNLFHVDEPQSQAMQNHTVDFLKHIFAINGFRITYWFFLHNSYYISWCFTIYTLFALGTYFQFDVSCIWFIYYWFKHGF